MLALKAPNIHVIHFQSSSPVKFGEHNENQKLKLRKKPTIEVTHTNLKLLLLFWFNLKPIKHFI